MTKGLESLFYPRTIAVVGVSRKAKSIGREILRNLIEFGFDGRIYPVNPSAYSINSLRCYESIGAIPEDEIDLVVIVVPSSYVKEVMLQAVEKKAKAAVIITAGFREVGERGLQVENEIAEIARNASIRVIGPNCMGILNGHAPHLNATFAPLQPLSGNIGFISQSGALGVVVMEYATSLNLGFSKFVSLGNKMDVNANTMLEYFAEDEDTKVILAYLESFSEPRNFSTIAKRVSKSKPILMLKSGRTSEGARAATSHTGAMAGKDSVISAAMESAGVIRVNSVEELFDSAMGFLKSPLPRGKRIAVLTNAGGPGTLLTDALISDDLEIPTLSDETQEKLRKVIPPEASPLNPVDLIASADADRYANALKILLEDEDVDAVIVVFVPPLMIQTINVANAINQIMEEVNVNKPVICTFMGRNELIKGDKSMKFPIYEFPESAARVMKHLYDYSVWTQSEDEGPEFPVGGDVAERARKLLKKEKRKKSKWLRAEVVHELLELYGFKFPESDTVDSLEELIEKSNRIGFPVVVKIASTAISHKSDKGGVHLDLRTNDELIVAWRAIQKVYSKARVPEDDRKILVQKYYKGGVEMALGGSTDPQFGKVVMLGSGGVLIELLKDVVFRLVPLTRKDAREMINSLRSYPLLLGYRGEPEVDIHLLENALLTISQMLRDLPEITEMDINPLLTLPIGKDPVVLDARISIR